ncbi:penicillin-binding protein 1C [Pseudocnuella soli]|uniref:penicillin-binding protein 1C n=1 Tax=Pseudocnuella soli TaxID=2502779 RepID=UPI001053EC7A|nr:penicillin-binding protein 1C [Pseudocnuella soli]
MNAFVPDKLLQKITAAKGWLYVKRLVIALLALPLLFLLLHLIFPLRDAVAYSTIITDERGQVLHAYLTPDQKWRMKTELSEISPLLQKAIVAKEDRYFFHHPGVNPFAVGRALVNNISKGRRTSGASTITMQVARLLHPQKRTAGAKVVEAFRALQLEWKYSKKEILQLYLNLVPYGGNIEGVKSAAWLYFQKSPEHLSLAEIVALSIIPNRPSSLVVGKNNDAIIEGRNMWLQRLAATNVFTTQEIEDALAEPLLATRHSVPRHIPHLAYKLSKASSDNNIKSFIWLNTQLKIEKLVADYVRSLRLHNIHNASVVVIDNQSHKVVSYVGSADFYDTTDGGQVNGAAAVRQPGSTLKPLVYGLCMDEGLLTPKQILYDVPIVYDGYAPENYDRQYSGPVTVEYALAHSLNIPAVRSLKQLGKDKIVGKLSAIQFKQIRKDESKLGLSLILGGCGTTLEELTGLFSAFANGGTFVAPHYAQTDERPLQVPVLSSSAAFFINNMLSKADRPDFPINWQATEHMPRIAWKTGTSYGRRDAWSIGYNKRFTVGVWVGNFSGLGVPDLSGAETATPLLFKIFNSIDYNSSESWFAPPEGTEQRQVCTQSGLPPSAYCTEKTLDYFIPLVSATHTCEHAVEIKIDPEERISYCSQCAPQSGYRKKLYPHILPEMQAYFAAKGTVYEQVPPHNPACEKIFQTGGPQIISPQNATEYFVSKTNPEPIQLSAQAGNDVSKLYWYVNDQFYKATGANEKPFYLPAEGPLKISCTDDKGRNRNVSIIVKYVDF